MASIIGTSSNDMLDGTSGDDVINGLAGADTMVGGAGNDIYLVDNPGDTVTEAAGGGTDTVFSSTNYTLTSGQAIEFLGTTSGAGTAALYLVGNELGQTVFGNAGDNSLFGLAGDDKLYGFGGHNHLYGGAGDDFLVSNGGIDTLAGAVGNDAYVVDSSDDKVMEIANAGNDTVFASAGYALENGQSVEHLRTTSVNGITAINLGGNELSQEISGNAGVNIITGGGGSDTLNGFAGNDTITGGNGHDQIDTGLGNDQINWLSVTQSTGVDRDLVINEDFGSDKLHFTVMPTTINTEVTTGGLNTVHFDANLAAAIGADQLSAGGAVLFDPDAGDLNHAGHVFLIVDANGQAGYQAGQDYVVELQAPTGSLSLSDFV